MIILIPIYKTAGNTNACDKKNESVNLLSAACQKSHIKGKKESLSKGVTDALFNSLTDENGKRIIHEEDPEVDADQSGSVNPGVVLSVVNNLTQSGTFYEISDVTADKITNLDVVLFAYNNSNAFVMKKT
ncbi:MAG: hypothetical protein JSS91_13470 [Bacteroidetes bacterium]|nr:hypothetical protein [Bacteroidota bacterium]